MADDAVGVNAIVRQAVVDIRVNKLRPTPNITTDPWGLLITSISTTALFSDYRFQRSRRRLMVERRPTDPSPSHLVPCNISFLSVLQLVDD